MMEPMEIEKSDANGCGTPEIMKNGLHLYPVSVGDSGEGLPYAPVDWPNAGDKWTWKVGKRIATTGYFVDRYLYPPAHLRKAGERKKHSFASKLSAEQYIRSVFPGADVNAFFGSFSWRIPSTDLFHKIGWKEGTTPAEVLEHSGSNSQIGSVCCKAGNRSCSSLVEAGNTCSEFMTCNICCVEQGFCRHCCCILCRKSVSTANGGYDSIKCEARVDGGFVCGHIAHIDCSLRAYMAGTVGGSIGLDAEYYCRRCDSRTDLILHVTNLIQTCEAIDSCDSIEKILSVGIRLLHHSQKARARQLLHHIQLAVNKLKGGTNLEDIWRKEVISSVTAGGSISNSVCALRFQTKEEPLTSGIEAQRALGSEFDHRIESRRALGSTFDHRIESIMLEDEIDQTLHNLRKSQAYEYKLAEEKLLAQKNYIQNLYEQLEKERCDLTKHASGVGSESMFSVVRERVGSIKQEVSKLKEMEEVANGFGRTSKQILKNHYGLKTE